MVRLKDSMPIRPRKLKINFNSTMVRLKETGIARGVLDQNKFQFHYGSVKRELLKDTDVALAYFNSTMVRLKVFSAIRAALLSIISIPLWFG